MNLEAYGNIIIMQTFEAMIEITFLKYSKEYVKVKNKPRQLSKLTNTTLMYLLLFCDLLTSIFYLYWRQAAGLMIPASLTLHPTGEKDGLVYESRNYNSMTECGTRT